MTLNDKTAGQDKSPGGEEEEEISPPPDIKDEKMEEDEETTQDITDNVCNLILFG